MGRHSILERIALSAALAFTPIVNSLPAKAESGKAASTANPTQKDCVKEYYEGEIDRLCSAINGEVSKLTQNPPRKQEYEATYYLNHLLVRLLVTRNHILDAGCPQNNSYLTNLNIPKLTGLMESIINTYDGLLGAHGAYSLEILLRSANDLGIKPDDNKLISIVNGKLFSGEPDKFMSGIDLISLYKIQLPPLSKDEMKKAEEGLYSLVKIGHNAKHSAEILNAAGWKVSLNEQTYKHALNEFFLNIVNEQDYVQAFKSLHYEEINQGIKIPLSLNKEQLKDFEKEVNAYFTLGEYEEALSAILVSVKHGIRPDISFTEKDIKYFNSISKEADKGIKETPAGHLLPRGGIMYIKILDQLKYLYPGLYNSHDMSPQLKEAMGRLKGDPLP